MRDFANEIKYIHSRLDKQQLPELYKSTASKKIITGYEDMYIESVNEYSDPTLDEIRFYTLVKHLQEHFHDNFYDFFKFTTKAERIQPIFRDVVDFHKYGMDSLPDRMKHAGEFAWNPNTSIELSLIVRGVGKSVYLMARAIWNVSKNISDKVLIIHGKKDMSIDDINLIKSLVISRELSLIYPQIFQDTAEGYKKRGGKMRSTELDLKPSLFLQQDASIDVGQMKKESSFGSASLNTNETGKHISRFFFDDLVNEFTSKNAETSENLISYFEQLEGLEEYDSDREYGGEGVGTQWWDDSLYQYLRDSGTCSYFSMPVEWTHKNTQYYISNIFDKEKLEKKMSKAGKWGPSFYYMVPRPLNQSVLDLAFDPQRHVMRLTDAEVQVFKKTMISVQACDPSYSKTGKKDGDSKSRFTILHCLMSNDTVWIYDVYSAKGHGSTPTIKLNVQHAIDHQIDVFVMDAQGTQRILYDDVERTIGSDYSMGITRIPVTNGSISKGLGKIETANNVMRDLFLEDKIKVILTDENEGRMQLVIDQLAGKDPGMDVIDCLVYTKLKVETTSELRLAQYRHGAVGGISRALRKDPINDYSKPNPRVNRARQTTGARACLK